MSRIARFGCTALLTLVAAGCNSTPDTTPVLPPTPEPAPAQAPANAAVAQEASEERAGPLDAPPLPTDPIPGPPYTFDAVGHAFAERTATGFTDAPPEEPVALAAWQQELRQALQDALGGHYARPDQVALGVEVLSTESFDGYRRDEITYFLEPHLRTRAFLYVPDGDGPHSAVVFWHGHVVGGHLASGGVPPFDNPVEAGGAQALADAGFLVLAPTVRSLHADRPTHAVFTRMMTTLGETPTALYFADARRAFDVLAARDDVDANRIAVTGVSLGGYIALVSAALDPRYAAASVHAFFPRYFGSLTRALRCPCTNAAEIADRVDLPELALLIAPRPLEVVVGQSDPEFDFAESRDAFRTVSATYSALGGTAKWSPHPGGHAWQASTTAWLRGELAE